MIIATAGHVDHGKTTLVRALTGVDTDRLPEEKRRGMTIDLGFAYQTLDNGTAVGFVDVPGHSKFIHTMVAGASAVDHALLIVAADDGPMPQTLEHLSILSFLGIKAGACIITKCDKVPPPRVEQVRDQIANIIGESCLKNAPIFAVSAETGEGLQQVRTHIEKTAKSYHHRDAHKPFRFVIDRVFNVTGSGTVATGTVVNGTVSVGDELTLAPSAKPVRVRGIHSMKEKLNKGVAGQRLGINIYGRDIDTDTVSRGCQLVASDRCHVTQRIDVDIEVASNANKALGPRLKNIHLHVGAAEIIADLEVLGQRSILPGDRGLAHLILRAPISSVCGERLIIRDSSATRTLAGGHIVEPLPPSRRIHSADRIDYLRAANADTPTRVLAQQLKHGGQAIYAQSFCQKWNLFEEDLRRFADDLNAEWIGTGDTAIILTKNQYRTFQAEIEKAVTAWHQDNPSSPGLSIEQARKTLSVSFTPASFEEILNALSTQGTIRRQGSFIAHLDFKAALPPDVQRVWEQVHPLLAAGGVQPPRVVELADACQVPTKTLTSALMSLAHAGLLHKIATNRFYLPSDLYQLAAIATSLSGETDEAGFHVRRFRDTTGLGRNLAIEVLEYFDAVGLTRRHGDQRTVINDPKTLFAQT